MSTIIIIQLTKKKERRNLSMFQDNRSKVIQTE